MSVFSTHITNSCRNWLEKIRIAKPYRIHIIEGKQLVSLLLAFPELVVKYFYDECSKLITNARQNWILHGLFPDPQTFFVLYKKVDPRKLSRDELAFLWCTSHYKSSEIDDWCETDPDNLWGQEDTLRFDFLADYLRDLNDGHKPLGILGRPNSRLGMRCTTTKSPEEGEKVEWINCYIQDKEDRAIEVKIESKGNGKTYIRDIPIRST